MLVKVSYPLFTFIRHVSHFYHFYQTQTQQSPVFCVNVISYFLLYFIIFA